jgi:hypothetical protein
VCIRDEANRFQLFRCPAQTSVWHGKCAVVATGCATSPHSRAHTQ